MYPSVPLRAAPKILPFLAILCAGCREGGRLTEPGGAADDTTDTDGGFDRAVLTVTVTLAEQDSALAARLGLESGVLPGAEVSIERQAGGDTVRSATTDEDGAVRFEELLPGRYDVSALRRLTEEEVARLGSENADVTGFGGGGLASVEAPASDDSVEAAAGRRGSLVVSEFYSTIVDDAAGNTYPLGGYFEVYNNSDTTIHLSGKVLFKAMVWLRDYSSPRSCEEMEQWRNDPEGIWTQWIYAFPSAAAPLAPGEAAAVATDAIDHREIDERLLDLRDADFEFLGPSDVDNPSVPNMVTLGDHWSASLYGHGLYGSFTNDIIGVAEPVEVDALVQDNLPVLDPEFWRIPGEKILDVFTVVDNDPALPPPCPQLVHETFDRQFSRILDVYSLRSMKRREFATLPDGRVILQRTKTSSRDFALALTPTPGTP